MESGTIVKGNPPSGSAHTGVLQDPMYRIYMPLSPECHNTLIVCQALSIWREFEAYSGYKLDSIRVRPYDKANSLLWGGGGDTGCGKWDNRGENMCEVGLSL